MDHCCAAGALRPLLWGVVGVVGALEPRGPAARRIDDLWIFMLVAGSATFAFVVVLLLAGLRRRGHPAVAAPEEGRESVRWWLVGGGVVLPFVVVLAVLVGTIQVMQATPATTKTRETIRIIGHRWRWEVRYPNGSTTTNVVRIPAGEPVQLELTSADVIHSFWVPALAGKRDLLPDGITHLVIEADRPGRYEGQCAEFCGLHHATMRVAVVAEERDAYDRWMAEGAPSG